MQYVKLTVDSSELGIKEYIIPKHRIHISLAEINADPAFGKFTFKLQDLDSGKKLPVPQEFKKPGFGKRLLKLFGL